MNTQHPSNHSSILPEVAALNARGLDHQKAGRHSESIQIFTEALTLSPDSGILHYNLANSLKALREFETALSHYRKSLELGLKIPEVLNNLGVCLRDLKRYNEALDCFKGAVYLDPSFLLAHLNMGFLWLLMEKPSKALAPLQDALKINPHNPDAHWFLAHTFLILGDYEKGWEEYEWRWQKVDSSVPQRVFPEPTWTGEEFKGRTLLVWCEQGFGDTLQFIRFAKPLKEMGGAVILECPESLRGLLRRTQGLDRVVAQGESLPAFDLQCPLLSLPRLLGTTLKTLPAEVPYVEVDPDILTCWNMELADAKGGKVGLVWSGNIFPDHNRHRSLDPEMIRPLFQVPGVRFYSLQKGEAASEASKMPVIDFSSRLTDFAQTAGLMKGLDLVITIDTSVAHLAGALGKEVWTLLPFSPDWRWFLERADSPWYPSMRLFRQPKPGDWKSVIKQIARELKRLFETRK
jgi:Tfp pilus assembly protein PilF